MVDHSSRSLASLAFRLQLSPSLPPKVNEVTLAHEGVRQCFSFDRPRNLCETMTPLLDQAVLAWLADLENAKHGQTARQIDLHLPRLVLGRLHIRSGAPGPDGVQMLHLRFDQIEGDPRYALPPPLLSEISGVPLTDALVQELSRAAPQINSQRTPFTFAGASHAPKNDPTDIDDLMVQIERHAADLESQAAVMRGYVEDCDTARNVSSSARLKRRFESETRANLSPPHHRNH
jgi:hypothetical protein